MIYVPPRRVIRRVFIHCSASDVKAHDNVETIRKWHLDRGWSDIGYHAVIDKTGFISAGRDLERRPAAQKEHNTATVAICVTGLAKFTVDQMASLAQFCMTINIKHDGAVTFHGHNEVNPYKSCPVFDYRAVLRLDNQGRMCRA